MHSLLRRKQKIQWSSDVKHYQVEDECLLSGFTRLDVELVVPLRLF